MWGGGAFRGAGGASVGGVNSFVRYFSRKRAENLRKINPKVPPQDASSIARALYDVIKQHGPLSVSNAWIRAKVLLSSPVEALSKLECSL